MNMSKSDTSADDYTEMEERKSCRSEGFHELYIQGAILVEDMDSNTQGPGFGSLDPAVNV
jgi:hypothetical protein